jgi:ribosome biogenesis protein BRX1
MTGNCLLYSRPLLIFDKAFHTFPHLTLIKEMFTQAFGTPRNHPKSKPFFDHVFSFFYFDNKIWFRHYQISPRTERDQNKPLKQCLTEIGPRFVLNPIKIFEDSFAGRVIYKNPHYISVSKVGFFFFFDKQKY